MKFRLSSLFRRKKKDSLKLDASDIFEAKQKVEFASKHLFGSVCKHFLLPINSIEGTDFEASLGELCILPNEVLELILIHLSPIELIKASRTSKAFWVFCTENNLWKELYKTHRWHSQEPQQIDFDRSGNSNSTAQASVTRDPCCWKEHFKVSYFVLIVDFVSETIQHVIGNRCSIPKPASKTIT